MSTVVIHGPIQGGRFPRWGYLDKFYMNELLPKSLFLGIALIAAVMGTWRGVVAIQHYRHRQVAMTGPAKKVRVKVLTAADLGVPPSLTQQQTQQMNVTVKARPAVAMPKPVPDEKAVDQTIATTEEMSAMGAASNTSANAIGAGDSLVVDTSGGGLPGPEDYVAFEKEPELVNMSKPVYPDLAREAGVEGTVLIRVLVGEDGFVKNMIIVQSVPMLDDAAAAAAQTAVFKPALQKDKPVAVWMVIPIEFKLHG